MLSFLFLLLLFSFSSTDVLADGFTNTGENTKNQLLQTVAYTIGSYPSEIADHIVWFDKNDVIGVDKHSFLGGNDITTVTDFGGSRRIPHIADRVALPPESRIDIIYMYKNQAGHDINLSYILLPFSSSSSDDSSLSHVVRSAVPPIGTSVGVYREGVVLNRIGRYFVSDSILSIPNSKVGNIVATSVYVKNPLEIRSMYSTKVGNSAKITLILKNTSISYLYNLHFEHLGYEEEFDLEAYGEKKIEYTLENVLNKKEVEVNLGTARIENPNRIKKCAVGEEENFKILGIYTTSVFSHRLDGGYSLGALTAPDVGSFCISMIPYTMSSNSIVVSNPATEEDDEEVVEDTQVETVANESNSTVVNIPTKAFERGSESVLGVTLPKTFVNQWGYVGLLVVDVYLWYSFFRERKIYENKYKNTKVCTKSS